MSLSERTESRPAAQEACSEGFFGVDFTFLTHLMIGLIFANPCSMQLALIYPEVP